MSELVKKDSCGCIIERKYASDYLIRRLYNDGKGKELCNIKIDSSRWFKLYYKEGLVTYRSSECPVLVISLEALCEAYEENGGKISVEKAIDKLKSVKGFQVTDLVKKIAQEFCECVSNG